jgi:glutathione S-transferase
MSGAILVYLALRHPQPMTASTTPHRGLMLRTEIALALVLSKKCDEAIEMFRQAFERDVATWIIAETDDLLDPMRHLPKFQSLIESTMPP